MADTAACADEDWAAAADVEEVVARLSSHPLRASFEADADADDDASDADPSEPAGALPTATDSATRGVRVMRDVVYYSDGPDAHPHKHRLNVYLPPDAARGANLPCVIHIHGGGWQRGDRNTYFYGAPFMSAGYAAAGFVAVAPSYRLASTAKFPAQAIDCARAVRWVIDHADELGVDTSHVFLSGHSAGGHLVSLVSLHDKFLADVGLDASVIRGVVSISGIYDLFSPMTLLPQQSQCSIKTAFFRRLYVRPTFGLDTLQWKDASPLEHLLTVKRQISPFLVINAQADLGLQFGAQVFVEAMKNRGLPVTHHVVPNTSHADVTRHLSTLTAATSFIRELLT